MLVCDVRYDMSMWSGPAEQSQNQSGMNVLCIALATPLQMVLRMHSMGLQLFLPWSVLGCAVRECVGSARMVSRE